jgi:hypothetical protein
VPTYEAHPVKLLQEKCDIFNFIFSVPFEYWLVVQALSSCEGRTAGGSTNSISNFHHHNINGGAVDNVYDVTGIHAV